MSIIRQPQSLLYNNIRVVIKRVNDKIGKIICRYYVRLKPVLILTLSCTDMNSRVPTLLKSVLYKPPG